MIPNLRSSTRLDRQSHRRGDSAYVAGLAGLDSARFLVLVDSKPVIVSNEARTLAALRWFRAVELEMAGIGCREPLFLGVEREGTPSAGAGRFALGVSEMSFRAKPAALEMLRPAVDLRSLAMQGVLSSEDLSLVGNAKALHHWHENSRCCGRCGGATKLKDGGWRRRCWACGTETFPRTDPVVIMLIEHPDRRSCLLGRSARFAPGMYSALAGFIEPGEDVEDAVRRETFEEAGIEVGDVVYHSTQPWPFPHSLMIGCTGYATSATLRIDKDELEDARWFSRDEARRMLEGCHPDGLSGPGRQAIARALMQSFVEGRS